MHLRRSSSVFILILAAVPAFAGDRVASENFIVDAPNRELARKFADAAEYYRKEKAMDWLGQEMPNWKTKCPLKVIVTLGAAGGATTFTFDGGPNGESKVASREMEIKGKLDQLLDSVLPHEVTHTVLAHYFGRPVPRWADEGGSVLSENDEERYKHDISARELLNQGRGIKLRHLFTMKEYPRDMIVTYAEGYSVVRFLVDQGGRKKFLTFVAEGMKGNVRNWDEACRNVYGYQSVDALEDSWIQSLYKPPARTSARTQSPNSGLYAGGTSSRPRTEIRSSAAPGLPVLAPPIVARGAAPDRDDRSAVRTVPTGRQDMPPPVSLLLPPQQTRK
ncbi:MAG TPA: hypothetical protein VGJ05_11640 [Fimbriiglobus sp.]|jgi:hypothetical protein